MDLNGDIPKLKDNATVLDGDLTLGYQGESFGVTGRGSLTNYDVTDDASFSQTERGEGSLEGWWMTNLGAKTKLELRAVAGALLYNTDASNPNTGLALGDESSVMGRGSALAGVRLHPRSDVALALYAGAGGQYEFHDSLKVFRNAGQVQGQDEERLTARGEGRVRFQWNAVPDVFSLRLRVDGSVFKLTRDTFAYQVGTATGIDQTQTRTELLQMELFSRGFFDVDAVRFLDFVPSVHGGLNYVYVSGEGTSQSSVVPLVGIGIRREAL